jgi:hypothetical protein
MSFAQNYCNMRSFLCCGTAVLALGATACGEGEPSVPSGETQASSECRSAPRSEQNEFAGRIAVSAALSPVPAVSQTSELRVVVEAEKTYERATIAIELPPQLAFDGVPEGMRPSPEGAVGSRPIDAGKPVELLGTVRAQSAGAGQVRALVSAPVPGGADGGSAEIFLTVGATAAGSACQVATPPVGGVTTVSG